MNNIEKFEEALKDFSTQMNKRFYSKCKLGWTGWNSKTNYNDMANRMRLKAEAVACHADEENREKNLIDIANFALFLFTIKE